MQYDNTPQRERNKLIVDLMGAGKSASEVRRILASSSYGDISTNRIWKVWNTSPTFIPRRIQEKTCTFCREVREGENMKKITDSNKLIGRMCSVCWDRLASKNELTEDE